MTSDDIKRLNFYEKQFLRTQDFQDEQAYHIEMRRRHLIAHHTWGIVVGLNIEPEKYFKLTDSSFQKLKAAGVEDKVLESLKSLKDKEFTEDELLDAVKNQIGKALTDKYKKPILENAEKVRTSNTWSVKPGMAVDGFGREIVVFAPEPLDTTQIAAQLAGPPLPATLKVWIAYHTEKSDRPLPGYEVCDVQDQFTRVQETFRLIYQDDPGFDLHEDSGSGGQNPDNRETWPRVFQDLPDDPGKARWPVYLGTITWGPDPNNSSQNIITVDPKSKDDKNRRYVGLVGGEIFSPTDLQTLDVHATKTTFDQDILVKGTTGDGKGRLRLDVDNTDASVITNKKAPTQTNPNPPSKHIYLRTNNESGGNNIIIDRDTLQAQTAQVSQDLTVDGKIVVKGTVGDGAGKLLIEADSNDTAVLTRAADNPASSTHDLAIRTNNNSGGNKVLIDKDAVLAKRLDVAESAIIRGDLTIDAGKNLNMHGGQIALKETSGGEDTDPMRIFRQKRAADQNDMRLQIGDNISGDDRLVVGPVFHVDGQFKEQFVVKNNGDAQIARNLTVNGDINVGGQVDDRNVAADGVKLDSISQNAKNVAVRQGILADGGTIPLPSGFSEVQCKWIVSPYLLAPPFFDINENGPNARFQVECYTTTGRRVTVGWWQQGHSSTSGFNRYGGWANYIIIGVM
jgi:hypothetical protein